MVNFIFVFFYFAGFDTDILGFPRYHMVGDRDNGVFNLRIVNVSLEDDSQFECQVSPLRKDDKIVVTQIRSGANLTVLCKYTRIMCMFIQFE